MLGVDLNSGNRNGPIYGPGLSDANKKRTPAIWAGVQTYECKFVYFKSIIFFDFTYEPTVRR